MRTGRVFYGWWIVGVMLVALMVGSGLTFWSFTVYIPPLEAEFGWSRAQVSSAFSVGVIVSGVSAPFVGRVIDRVGARRAIGIGSVGMLITFVLFTRVQSLWQYLAVFGLQSFVVTWVMGLPTQWLITQWFVRRRGLALGIATAGFGLGGSVFLPLITVVIDRWGWRTSYLLSGVLLVSIYMPLAVFLIRDRPRDLGQQPDGDPTPLPGSPPRHPVGEAWPVARLLRSRQFWMLALVQMLFFGALDSFSLHSVPFFQSEGRTATFGAAVVAAASLVRTPARMAAGWLMDRLPSLMWVAIGMSLVHAGGLVLLVISSQTGALVAFALLWGMSGGFGPLVLSLQTARTFGTASFATVSGALFAAETVGAVALPPLGGLLYDRLGNYDIAFGIYAASFALSAVAWWGFFSAPSPSPSPALARERGA